MLQLRLPPANLFDESTSTFIESPEVVLQLEHSLISLSKWESRWEKPFLAAKGFSAEELLDYVRCMSVVKLQDPNVVYRLTQEDMIKIQDYIGRKMTATTITKPKNRHSRSRKIITSEVIYGWMVDLGIPFECEKWHLNRLLTLIEVCSTSQNPNKKMSKKDIFGQNMALNAARKARLGTKG